MFEQVRGLSVDLEGVLIVEKIRVESLTHASKCITNGYRSPVIRCSTPTERNQRAVAVRRSQAGAAYGDWGVSDPCRATTRTYAHREVS